MNAQGFAAHIFDLMQKANDQRYYSPELEWDERLPECPPVVKVWDAEWGTERVIAFADDETSAEETLRYARDMVNSEENSDDCWPEAWWDGGKIEGWEEPAL
jgi:hypothetical protein